MKVRAGAASAADLILGAGLLMGAAPADAATITAATGARTAAGTASAQDISWAQATAQTDLAEITIGPDRRAARAALRH